MNIQTELSYTTNKFIFLSELSQWNDLTCSPNRKKVILNCIGELSQEEKQAVQEFTLFFQNSQHHPEHIFLFETEEKIWPKLKQEFKTQEFYQLTHIFNKLEGKFSVFWQNKYPELVDKRNVFANNTDFLDKYINLISGLCNLSTQKNNDILLKLAITLDETDIASWTFNKTILLETKKSLSSKHETFKIFLHECFHILLKENKPLFSRFQKILKNTEQVLPNYPNHIVYEESLISSFLPEGYLGEIISPEEIDATQSNPQDDLLALRYICAKNMRTITQKYIEFSKPLDDYFFYKIKECVEKFKKQRNLNSSV